mmetsp:Transcript_12998/g.20157  ORF Transcript_12998/g.20157 Transcript_12998/m.20157 type:complete len:88 (+) Transcript_12998:174-437(+)
MDYCETCELSMCYVCSNEHFDGNHRVSWGFDIFKDMEPPRSDLNEVFNSGYRTLFDWESAKCPCGKKLIGSVTSTICVACGTATCSP